MPNNESSYKEWKAAYLALSVPCMVEVSRQITVNYHNKKSTQNNKLYRFLKQYIHECGGLKDTGNRTKVLTVDTPKS